MKREVQITEDGSSTLFVPELNEHYHSVWGAATESLHVFIKEGMQRVEESSLSILEVGFGTGLNALLTYLHRNGRSIKYHAYEPYPLTHAEYSQLDFSCVFEDNSSKQFFDSMHNCNWDEEIQLTPDFTIKKIEGGILLLDKIETYNLVYFDAFAPNKQEDMWSETIFQKVYNSMIVGGVLTTYCAKGSVRRTMQSVGFEVHRVPGPPMKREMLVAVKK